MEKLKRTIKKASGIIAPLAHSLAVMSMYSTCVLFSNQPTPPKQMDKYRKLSKHD